MVFNGIHGFIVEPDLVQRCLTLMLKPIDDSNRKSESQIFSDFQNDLPKIFRGILNLISNIFVHLPSVETTNPERMLEFVQWLAAYEKANNVPAGVYQMQYSTVLNDSMQDSLLEDPLAAAVVTVADKSSSGSWSSTPTDLLEELPGRDSHCWPSPPQPVPVVFSAEGDKIGILEEDGRINMEPDIKVRE